MDLIELHEQFERVYGHTANVIASAPGRLEVLGNHTDYNAGLTLSCAIGFRCYVAVARLDQLVAKLMSTTFDPSPALFRIDQPELDAENGHWSRYVLGLVDALKRRGHHAPGFAMLIDSKVPQSAGVSSSAALEMAALAGLVHLMGAEIHDNELARIGQESESRAVGAQTGLLDQLTSLLGKRDQLIKIDFQSMDTQMIPAPMGWCFVAVDSGVKHDLTKEYNARRSSCEAAAKAMGLESLRLATDTMLESSRGAISDEDYHCAKHVLEENQRVQDSVAALAAGSMLDFGQLLFDSHQSSQSNFKNSCPELDELIAYARADERCIGARLSGGGFGGISIHLVKKEDAEDYRTALLKAIDPLNPTCRWSAICEISDGVQIYDSVG
jgi:galactokinase